MCSARSYNDMKCSLLMKRWNNVNLLSCYETKCCPVLPEPLCMSHLMLCTVLHIEQANISYVDEVKRLKGQLLIFVIYLALIELYWQCNKKEGNTEGLVTMEVKIKLHDWCKRNILIAQELRAMLQHSLYNL
jgi:hypothetical protein